MSKHKILFEFFTFAEHLASIALPNKTDFEDKMHSTLLKYLTLSKYFGGIAPSEHRVSIDSLKEIVLETDLLYLSPNSTLSLEDNPASSAFDSFMATVYRKNEINIEGCVTWFGIDFAPPSTLTGTELSLYSGLLRQLDLSLQEVSPEGTPLPPTIVASMLYMATLYSLYMNFIVFRTNFWEFSCVLSSPVHLLCLLPLFIEHRLLCIMLSTSGFILFALTIIIIVLK